MFMVSSINATKPVKSTIYSLVVSSFEAVGQAYQAMPAILQRLKSVVCSAVDPSLRKELPNAIQSLLLRNVMKTVI